MKNFTKGIVFAACLAALPPLAASAEKPDVQVSSATAAAEAPKTEALKGVLQSVDVSSGALTVRDMATGQSRVFKITPATRITAGGNKKRIPLNDLKAGSYANLIVTGDVAGSVHVFVGAAKISPLRKLSGKPAKKSASKNPSDRP